MNRALVLAIAVLFVGCGDPDTIALKTALENTEKGEYVLIAVSEVEPKLVSFQKSWDHKKQYYFQDDERDAVLKRVAAAIEKARKTGHEISTMGFYEFLDE